MPRLDVAGSQRRSKSEIDWFKKFPAGQTLFGKAESADQKLRGVASNGIGAPGPAMSYN